MSQSRSDAARLRRFQRNALACASCLYFQAATTARIRARRASECICFEAPNNLRGNEGMSTLVPDRRSRGSRPRWPVQLVSYQESGRARSHAHEPTLEANSLACASCSYSHRRHGLKRQARSANRHSLSARRLGTEQDVKEARLDWIRLDCGGKGERGKGETGIDPYPSEQTDHDER